MDRFSLSFFYQSTATDLITNGAQGRMTAIDGGVLLLSFPTFPFFRPSPLTFSLPSLYAHFPPSLRSSAPSKQLGSREAL